MSLRTLRKSDLGALEAWVPAIAGAVGCDRWANPVALKDAVGHPDILVYRDEAGEAFISSTPSSPMSEAARIDLLAVPTDTRRLGIGGRAAIALEKHLAKSTRRIYVAVPSTIGLALYFWLRLGYRPLLQSDWPVPLEGTSTWMVCELH